MSLSQPQKDLLREVKEAGVLYIRTYSRFGRTAEALVKKGLLRVVERYYSRYSQHGYSVVDERAQP